MDILCISDDLRLIGLASRLVTEGHTVKLYTTAAMKANCGFFTQVSHPYEAIKDCKFIVADKLPSDSQVYKWAKTFNKPIIGASPLTDMMNADCYREFQIAQKLGISVPTTEVISDVGEMFDKVLDWNPVRTLVRYDRETIACDHQQWLAWAMGRLPMDKHILLQVPQWGEDIAVTGWFDGIKWAGPFAIKSNKEKDLNASLMLALHGKHERLIQMIEPFGGFLKNVDYHGPFTVRCVASKNAIQLISTHTGFESPSMYAFFEGLKEPAGDFLHRIAFSVCNDHDITNDYMSAIVVKTSLKDPQNVPIVGIDEGNLKHLFFGSVKKEQEDYLISNAADWIYAVTAHGRDPDESFGRVYHTSQIVRVPDPIFTTGMASVYKPWISKIKSLELI